ncbi:MAG: GNAT family N-acetyltransferase [Mesorhizobium sp.]|nr:MAG: GNAT family N-acetyltransferase [Mesorhizobium sp.]TIO33312.1 MAG: GNAT family N-acetyltransferase [Mesorhizobium sp.]TIP08926.1 MAG: GNAT family N-acetyltransferase [Mesorhizobium sp.]
MGTSSRTTARATPCIRSTSQSSEGDLMPVISKQGIRLARHEELDEISALVSDAFTSFQHALPRHIFEPYANDACDLAGRWEDASLAVFEHQGRLVGTVSYYAEAVHEGMGWPPGLAGLRTLAVAPSAQGHGYGRALCEWCVMRARQQGAGALALHTASFMTSACMLYENLGFQRRPAYDLFASDILGFDPALGDQKVIAYLLPFQHGDSPDR